MPKLETQAIRLLVVDDHAMFREGIAALLEREPDLEVTGKFGSAEEALRALDGARPAIVLLDFDLGRERAVDFIRGARAAGFEGRVLVVTAGVSEPEAMQLIRAGVAGILHKHNPPETLCAAIRQVASGEVFLEKNYLKPLFRTVDQTRAADQPRLTERDKTILRAVFQGMVNKEIGARLQLSEGAVKACLRQLFRKLGVHTRAQLVKVALEQYRDQL
ncbi:MAG: response regulator transcription factor [Bryobacteraceae bacterium]|jgi:two-component system nitrate/nitrite response regulator NarL